MLKTTRGNSSVVTRLGEEIERGRVTRWSVAVQ